MIEYVIWFSVIGCILIILMFFIPIQDPDYPKRPDEAWRFRRLFHDGREDNGRIYENDCHFHHLYITSKLKGIKYSEISRWDNKKKEYICLSFKYDDTEKKEGSAADNKSSA